MTNILAVLIDPTVLFVSILAIAVILIGLFLKRIKQPYIVGYILIGMLLGENGLALIKHGEEVRHLGEMGIILLMFFIGMEFSLPELVKKWKVAAYGTLLQVGVSVLSMLLLGYIVHWNFDRAIVFGLVVSLSSSAVIIKLIQDKNLINSRIGKNVFSILLTQDILIVPLLILVSLLGGEEHSTNSIFLMLAGGGLIVGILLYIFKKQSIKLPFGSKLEEDHELQVFLALFLCFGGALISSLFGLSPALGAFIGGMIIHAGKATEWIYDTLHSFRVLFVALFFVSIGLQIDLDFLLDHSLIISIVLMIVYVTNHLINSIILRLFACTWQEAFMGGALLAQIGELSFLIISASFHVGIIGQYEYTFVITLISLTLFISPFWISLSERLVSFIGPKTAINYSS